MATTQVSYPNTPSASRENIVWKIESDTTDLVHLLIEPVINSVKQPVQIVQLSPDGYYYFDARETVTDIIALRENLYQPTEQTFIFKPKPDLMFETYLNVYEVIISGGVYVDTYPATADLVCDGIEVIEASIPYKSSSYFTDYYVLLGTTSLFHTTAPRTGISVNLTDNYYMNCYRMGFAVTDAVRVKTYNLAGTFVDTIDLNLTVGTGGEDLMTFTCGPVNINSDTPGMISASTGYYTVEVWGDGAKQSEAFRFNVNHETTPKTLRVYWIGELGAWEAYSFTDFIQKTDRTSSSMIEKYLPSVYDANGRGLMTLSANADTLLEVTSEPMKWADITWLSGIRKSPVVLVQENGTGSLLPVVVLPDDQMIDHSRIAIPTISLKMIYSQKQNYLRN